VVLSRKFFRRNSLREGTDMVNEEVKIDAWGQKYDDSISYAPSHSCPTCGIKFYGDNFAIYIVGFSPIAPTPKRDLGMVIMECPKCFAKFWFHFYPIDKERIERKSGRKIETV